MAGFLLGFFTVVMVLASIFMIFLVLLQRGSEGGGGSAFGGGAAESAFGGETSRVLTRTTVTTAVIFFVVGLGLYLGQIAAHKKAHGNVEMDKVVLQADAAAQAKANASQPEATPRPGEETARAMKVLDAETKSGTSGVEAK